VIDFLFLGAVISIMMLCVLLLAMLRYYDVYFKPSKTGVYYLAAMFTLCVVSVEASSIIKYGFDWIGFVLLLLMWLSYMALVGLRLYLGGGFE